MDFKLQLNQNELDLNFKGFGECSNHTIFEFRGLDDLCTPKFLITSTLCISITKRLISFLG
jgi:hypothetical protein